MSDGLEPTSLPDGLDIPAEDWQQTPHSVRLGVLALLNRLAALEARLHQDSSNSSRPPSTDAPAQKRQRRINTAERRRPGGKPGHPGPPPVLLAPTTTLALGPEMCSCGARGLVDLLPYHTHQVLEMPGLRPDVTHGLLHQGRCPSCGTRCTASLPAEHVSGYGPRLTGCIGEMAGMVGASRSAVQDLGASVCGIPLRKGALQKRVDRISTALVPDDDMLGPGARSAAVNDSDETAWLVHGDRPGLWVMAAPEVADCHSHPTRSKAAFVQRLADWTGILVSAG